MLRSAGFDREALQFVLGGICERIQRFDTDNAGTFDDDGQPGENEQSNTESASEYLTAKILVQFVDQDCSSIEIEQVFIELVKKHGDVARSLIKYIRLTV